jgi:hypothetical protein
MQLNKTTRAVAVLSSASIFIAQHDALSLFLLVTRRTQTARGGSPFFFRHLSMARSSSIVSTQAPMNTQAIR